LAHNRWRGDATPWGFIEKLATRTSPEKGGNSEVSTSIVVVLPARAYCDEVAF
jgi:hypothetical protein